MRIFTEQAIKEYAEAHPDAKVALQEWTTIVKRSEWTCAYSGGYPFSISGDIRSVPS